uniref:pro-adrenomedullin-like isoform X2 n=1 Tax=Solea senegalensis TaxID=28829 RepID=UPI001CD8D194|nr:pro-adrenomedullin-like isoform X2 [Solea senegalensis]
MRLALHTIICCCVFTTVLPLVKCDTGELNFNLKKRFRVWLQGHMKRDLGSILITAKEPSSDIHVGQEQDENGQVVLSPLRTKRTTSSKLSGCALVTCVNHDLIYRLLRINNNQKDAVAPEEKIGSNGYGRRRRRSPLDVVQFTVQKKISVTQDMEKEPLVRLYSTSETPLDSVDDSEKPIIDPEKIECACFPSGLSVSELVCELWMNSS